MAIAWMAIAWMALFFQEGLMQQGAVLVSKPLLGGLSGQVEVLEKCLSPPLPPDGKAEASPWDHAPHQKYVIL